VTREMGALEVETGGLRQAPYELGRRHIQEREAIGDVRNIVVQFLAGAELQQA
jgi:hypothetical protein